MPLYFNMHDQNSENAKFIFRDNLSKLSQHAQGKNTLSVEDLRQCIDNLKLIETAFSVALDALSSINSKVYHADNNIYILLKQVPEEIEE